MGDRKAPSPPPGDPDYVGPAQVKPEPPPAPPAKRGDVDVLARALAFVAEFQGDQRCALNCMHSEALAAEVHRLRSEAAPLLDALNCEPWHYVGTYDDEACFWCGAKRFSRATDEAPHDADCPWARLSPHTTAVALRKYLED